MTSTEPCNLMANFTVDKNERQISRDSSAGTKIFNYIICKI